MAKTFEFLYQAAGAATGLTVQADVYDATHALNTVFSGEMTEIGATGRYYKSFDADAPDWSVACSDTNGGRAAKLYDKAAYDAHGVTELVANVQTAVDNAVTAIATLQSLAEGMDGKIDTVDTNVVSLVSAVGSLATQLGGVEDKIDGLDAPAMMG